MKILTIENKPYDLDCIPDHVETVEECLRYCILDCADKTDIDYFFVPLVFLESFYAPAIVLQIGEHKLKMPLDWSILVCDDNFNDIEVMPLSQLNDREFFTISCNPMKSMIPDFVPVEIVNVYMSVKWYMPKLKHGHVLPVPLNDEQDAPCAFFVKDINKIPDPLDLAQIIGG
jgi:hypothetical protein